MSSGSNQNWFFNPIEQSDLDTATKALLAHVSQIPDPERAKNSWQKEEDIGSICNTK